jgi:8-oxo-dGTP diphosphatase
VAVPPHQLQILHSVAWICVRDGRLLVVRTRGNDLYYLPGGKPESGETESETLLREVREELCVYLVPSSIEYLWTIEDEAHGHTDCQLTMACYAAHGVGPPRIGGEIAEFAWVNTSSAEHCAPAVRQAMRRLAAVHQIA